MTASLETYMVVSLAFAVFAAVTAIGAAIVLGIGYERIRFGLERVKEGLDLVTRQSGYFSNAIFTLEKRVEDMDQKAQAAVQPQPAEQVRSQEPVAFMTSTKAKGGEPQVIDFSHFTWMDGKEKDQIKFM
ncbi:MAG: hypothetical protein AB7E85_06845 [Pseudobdellovibrionaceae bacterium]